MNIKFFLVPVHAQFVFYGQTFVKTSLNTAEDAESIGHIFDDDTEVEPLPEESDEKGNPQIYGTQHERAGHQSP